MVIHRWLDNDSRNRSRIRLHSCGHRMVQMSQRSFFDKPFDGDDYNDKRDRKRLTGQIQRVFNAMKSGRWMTLDDIVAITGDPHASVSAQYRHLQKPKFGNHTGVKRYIGNGLYEYRLIVNTEA